MHSEKIKLMARRKSVSDVPETGLPSVLERSPLLDRREIQSFTFTSTESKSKSVSAYKAQGYKPNSRSRTPQAHHSSKAAAQPLKTITERQTVNTAPGLQRTRSAPLPWYSSSPQYIPSYHSSPAFRSSPQYRVNPVVRFDERLLPERMNYGIAGYNTSRPRSFPGMGEHKRGLVHRRPRSLQIWRLWTRRFRERMTRIRVKSACSRLMMRFRRQH